MTRIYDTAAMRREAAEDALAERAHQARMTGPKIDVALLGGREGASGHEPYVERIPLVLNNRWEWVLPADLPVTEYPTKTPLGVYHLDGADGAGRPRYVWQQAAQEREAAEALDRAIGDSQ